MSLSLNLVYNHRYEGNINSLDQQYSSRFRRINHLIPFARSTAPNVLRVWENGFCFSSHVAQAYERIVDSQVSHYVFVADDLLLNPTLSEDNLIDCLGLLEGEGYIKNLASLGDAYYLWVYINNICRNFRKAGFAYEKELPEPGLARALYKRLGIPISEMRLRSLLHWDGKLMLTDILRYPGMVFELIRGLTRHGFSYPLLFGYSDFFVVPAPAFAEFARLCGVFGAINTFAEVAIPTALALACENVRTELAPGETFQRSFKFNPEQQWHGKELWHSEISVFESQYCLSLSKLTNEFPNHTIYIHPIKLSKWK
jgi:hypothetical protein